MRFDDEEILSIGDLIEKLRNHLEGINAPIWYRGQSISSWNLIPKLMRGSTSQSESYLINHFKQNATLLLQQLPRDEFEWLFLMQHHHMPTRLLDWTENPLVALFFAVTENPGEDGALWILMPTTLNVFSNFRPDFIFEIPSFEDEILKNYLPETVASEHRSRLFPMAAIAPRNSPRMQSQQGVFTISHRDNSPLEDAGAQGTNRDHVWRYIIPPESKSCIQEELKILGITLFQLFPELDSLANL